MDEALVGHTRETPSSPSNPEDVSCGLSCLLVGEQTAGHVLAGRIDGVAGFVGVLVHPHADPIALVDAVDEESGEGRVGGGQGEQRNQRCAKEMHFGYGKSVGKSVEKIKECVERRITCTGE